MKRRYLHRIRNKLVPEIRDGRYPIVEAYESMPEIIKRKPGSGYKHLLRKSEIYTFIELIPDWELISEGLDCIILDTCLDDCMGWHSDNTIAISAWEREIVWRDCDYEFYTEHRATLERLDVPVEKHGKDVHIMFTENTAKAFQLLHIFLHELGHHHDQMTTKKKRNPGRGELFAEKWALEYEELIFDEYVRHFEL
ncbi:MAG: hypothetical protein HRT89_10795 [Lentisphaeria bacterium]|nr:hypothetical protein [Lentisphaeria bacterium]NQZ68543.1 hypothetical protein [Lentisphaeria bacterium]